MPDIFCDILVRTHHEQLVAPSGSPIVDVGVDAEPIPAPGEQQKSAQGGEEGASEHAALLCNQMEGAKTASVDVESSYYLAGTVYSG